MFKQRRVPAKARRKTYAWSGDGVGVDDDDDEPEERHIAAGVGFDGWRYPEPEPEPAPAPSKRLALIRNGRRGFGLLPFFELALPLRLVQPPLKMTPVVCTTS